jgi:integrase
MERGHLAIRHARTCQAKGRDSRSCTCSPTVQARFRGMGVFEPLGRLPKGWVVDDLIEFETDLVELRCHLQDGKPLRLKQIVTLRDYAPGFFETLRAAVLMGKISPLTYNQYEGEWRNHIEPYFGKFALRAIDVPRLNAYLAMRLENGAAESTAKNSLTVLSAMLTDAMSEGLIEGNPCRAPKRGRHANRRVGVDLQVRRKPPKHLELDEVLALMTVTPDKYLDMVVMVAAHGLRRNESLGVHWEWLDFGQRGLDLRGQLQWKRGRPRSEWQIRNCKYDSQRVLPLYSGAAMLLARRRQATGPIFVDERTGLPYNETRPTQAFLDKAYADAGIAKRPGAGVWTPLRHTYASLLLAGGIGHTEVELLMGHKIPNTTGRYLHLMRSVFPKVEKILDEAFGDLVARRGNYICAECVVHVVPDCSEPSSHKDDRNDSRFSDYRF